MTRKQRETLAAMKQQLRLIQRTRYDEAGRDLRDMEANLQYQIDQLERECAAED